MMICFGEEIWRYGGLVTGVCNPSYIIELYKVQGNKRLRAERICQWEKEHGRIYPRLRFYRTVPFKILNKNLWGKVDLKDSLIPYKCTNNKYQ